MDNLLSELKTRIIESLRLEDISPGQIDVQTPDGSAWGYVPVEVETPQGNAYSTVNISNLSPALFTVGALNGSQLAAAVASGGTYIADSTAVPGITAKGENAP